jgi:transcription initiation factor TFIID TATA-box-binding protein
MQIVNIVTSGTLGQSVDLLKLLNGCDEFRYDPENYHGGYLQLSKYVATIYRSGKYIVPGVKAVGDIASIHQEIVSRLEHLLDASLIEPPAIKNIVATSQLDMPIDLPHLMTEIGLNTDIDVSYEPETFPGLIIRTEHGTSNVYRNGKYILLGTDNLDDLNRLDDRIRKIVLDHS